MGSKMGYYDHLGQEIEIGISFDDLADKLVRLNYGTHRFLSALVRARRRSKKHLVGGEDKLADAIEELLNRGCY